MGRGRAHGPAAVDAMDTSGTTRRAWRSLVVGLGAFALSACTKGRGLAKRCRQAAEKVEHVEKANITTRNGGEFEAYLEGTITVAASGRNAVLRVYDEAMRAVITTIHAEEGSKSAWRIGGLTGRGSEGTTVDVLALDPQVPAQSRKAHWPGQDPDTEGALGSPGPANPSHSRTLSLASSRSETPATHCGRRPGPVRASSSSTARPGSPPAGSPARRSSASGSPRRRW